MNPLGLSLQNAVLPGYLQQQPDVQLPTMVPNIPPPQAPQQPRMGKGQLIAGILADMLAGAQGRPGQFAQMMGQQRQEEREDVRWQKRRRDNLADYGEQQRLQREYAPPPAPSPMVRDTEAFMAMTDTQKAAFRMMNAIRNPLINLGDGNWLANDPETAAGAGLVPAEPSRPIPTAPVGILTPVEDTPSQRGPTPRASGTFRP